MMNPALASIIAKLNARTTLSALKPQIVWDQALEAEIEALDLHGNPDKTAIIALKAALHLRNDGLTISHSYAQEIEHDALGAYWHGIMHRMEGDYSNAKYWFRQAGYLTVHHPIQQEVSGWLQQHWDGQAIDPSVQKILLSYQQLADWSPSTFTDLVRTQDSHIDQDTTTILEHIQQIEIKQLFDYTWHKALQ